MKDEAWRGESALSLIFCKFSGQCEAESACALDCFQENGIEERVEEELIGKKNGCCILTCTIIWLCAWTSTSALQGSLLD